MLVFLLFRCSQTLHPSPITIPIIYLSRPHCCSGSIATANPRHPGSSSEMAIFSDFALDWILECTADPNGVSTLRTIVQQMGTKFSFSDKHPSGLSFCPHKDRPLWPLPDPELARTYIDGMSFSEYPDKYMVENSITDLVLSGDIKHTLKRFNGEITPYLSYRSRACRH